MTENTTSVWFHLSFIVTSQRYFFPQISTFVDQINTPYETSSKSHGKCNLKQRSFMLWNNFEEYKFCVIHRFNVKLLLYHVQSELLELNSPAILFKHLIWSDLFLSQIFFFPNYIIVSALSSHGTLNYLPQESRTDRIDMN